MFSSNQRLEISGDTKQELKQALAFAIDYSGRKTNYNDFVYQKVDNLFCIGTARTDNKEIGKWKRFDFDCNVDILTEIIWQFIQNQDFYNAEDAEYIRFGGADGSVDKGFIIRALDTEDACDRDLDETVDKMFYGIFYVQPFNSFYAK